MKDKSVFDNESGHRRPGMFGKQHVMPDAETDNDVKVSVEGIKDLCLEQGIAGCFELLRISYLLFSRHSQFCFIHGAAAADRGADIKSVAFKYGGSPLRFFGKTYTEGHPQFLGAYFFGKLRYLSDPGPYWYAFSQNAGSMFIISLFFRDRGLIKEVFDFFIPVSF